jgi:hypothetical protein
MIGQDCLETSVQPLAPSFIAHGFLNFVQEHSGAMDFVAWRGFLASFGTPEPADSLRRTSSLAALRVLG